MKAVSTIGALLLAAAAAWADEPAKAPAPEASATVPETAESAKAPETPPSVDFAVACSNAWLKCTTDKDAAAYEPGDDIKFVFTLAGVTNDVPKAKYKWRWTRKVQGAGPETGTAELEKKPFEYKTKLDAPGFVRVDIEIVTADGKPFEKINGKKKTPLKMACGAGVAPRKLEPPPLAKDFARKIADIKKTIVRIPPPQYRKIVREAVEVEGLKDVRVYAVSVPCTDERPVTGYLTVPEAAAGGVRYPCRLETVGCGFAAKQPLPNLKQIPLDTIVFHLAYDPGKSEERDDAFLTGVFQRVVRALQYMKSLPEWDGRNLVVNGWGLSASLAIWAAGCGEGVTKVVCGLFERVTSETFDPALLAGLVPADCFVDVQRVGLGDDVRSPADAMAIWNALDCDKRLVFVQGASGWSGPGWYTGRDSVLEKIRPVKYRNLDAKHCKDIRGSAGPAFDDLDFAFRDKVVVEAIVDYAKPGSFQPQAFGSLKSYAQRDLKPIEVYAVLPVKKPKDKQWEKFLTVHLGEKGGGFDFPFYLDAGMVLPPPDSLPWFHVLDAGGILRYSGPSQDTAANVARDIFAKLPEADPVFAYARLDLLKDEVGKLMKANTPGPRLYKAIEQMARRYSRGDKARAAEAEHLLLGMRQANERRVTAIKKLFGERAGVAYNQLLVFVKEWPTMEAHGGIKSIRSAVGQKPDIEKLAKLEAELQRLHAWKPVKTMDVRKKEGEMKALRAKVSRFAASKDVRVQGEAMLMQADIDNPPQEPEAEPAAAAE